MKATFIQTRPSLYELHLTDLPHSREQILAELRQESWTQEPGAIDGKFRAWGLTSTVLREYLDYFHSREFHQLAVEQLYLDSEFKDLWWTPIEKFVDLTVGSAIWTYDKPGYEASVHIDNRRLVASGMVFFNSIEENIDHSTVFYTDQHLSDPAYMPTGFGKGWLAANTHTSWHEGYNRSDQDRYNIYYSLMLKAFA